MSTFATSENNESSESHDQTQSGRRNRILLVDDDADMRSLLSDVLSDEGYEVIQAENGAEALLDVHREVFDVILLDKNMPGLSGMDLLPGLRMVCPATPVIIITAFGDAHTIAEGDEKGACGCLFKPFRIDDLSTALHKALATRAAPVATQTCQG